MGGKYTHLSQTSNFRQWFSVESNNVSSPSPTSFKPPGMTVKLEGPGRQLGPECVNVNFKAVN